MTWWHAQLWRRRFVAPLALGLALAVCIEARPACRLVIIGAGTPSTGSTHEMKLARLSLRDLGFGEAFDDAGYWKWHEHKNMGAEEARKHLDNEKVRWQSWTNDTIVLYKSHRYDQELLQLCHSFLVLLSHSGCLERTVLSALAAGFLASPPTVDGVTSFLQDMFHQLFLWRQHAAVDLSSEDLKMQPMHSAALVHHALAATLRVPYKQLQDAKLQKEVGKESNPSIPHREATPEVQSRLRDVLHAAKDKLPMTRGTGFLGLARRGGSSR